MVAVLGAFNKNPVGMSILGNQGSSINSSITSNFSDDRGNKTNIDEKENPINHDIENGRIPLYYNILFIRLLTIILYSHISL